MCASSAKEKPRNDIYFHNPRFLSSSATTLYSAGRPHRGQEVPARASVTAPSPSPAAELANEGIGRRQKKSSSFSGLSVFLAPFLPCGAKSRWRRVDCLGD